LPDFESAKLWFLVVSSLCCIYDRGDSLDPIDMTQMPPTMSLFLVGEWMGALFVGHLCDLSPVSVTKVMDGCRGGLSRVNATQVHGAQGEIHIPGTTCRFICTSTLLSTAATR